MKRPKRGSKNRFGTYLQELRSAAGWTLRELSKVTGISTTRLWGMEHDRHSPKLESLAALSRAFKQPLHRFLRPLG